MICHYIELASQELARILELFYFKGCGTVLPQYFCKELPTAIIQVQSPRFEVTSGASKALMCHLNDSYPNGSKREISRIFAIFRKICKYSNVFNK